MLSKIFDVARLEDEVDFLTAQSEQERQRRSNIKFWDVFRSKEIRLAFLVGAGLLVTEQFFFALAFFEIIAQLECYLQVHTYASIHAKS